MWDRAVTGAEERQRWLKSGELEMVRELQLLHEDRSEINGLSSNSAMAIDRVASG